MVTMPFSVNRQAIQMILDRVAQDFYATPLDTEAPCVTGGGNYYTEESTVTQKDDRAVEMLRADRDSRAELRANEIVQSVRAIDVADKPTGTVITFTKKYNGPRTYTYVAFKFSTGSGVNMWCITGQQGRLLDEELEEFLARDGGFDDYRYIDVITTAGDTGE